MSSWFFRRVAKLLNLCCKSKYSLLNTFPHFLQQCRSKLPGLKTLFKIRIFFYMHLNTFKKGFSAGPLRLAVPGKCMPAMHRFAGMYELK